ncbi:hypothetical protein PGB90_009394 [Kerria lacca]
MKHKKKKKINNSSSQETYLTEKFYEASWEKKELHFECFSMRRIRRELHDIRARIILVCIKSLSVPIIGYRITIKVRVTTIIKKGVIVLYRLDANLFIRCSIQLQYYRNSNLKIVLKSDIRRYLIYCLEVNSIITLYTRRSFIQLFPPVEDIAVCRLQRLFIRIPRPPRNIYYVKGISY